MTEIDKGAIDYKTELMRKSIHLCSLSFPIIYYFVTRDFALTVLIPFTIFSLVVDLARYLVPPFSKVFYAAFGFMLRPHEIDNKKKNLSGATYVLIAVTVVIFFFPKLFVIPALAVLIIGDIFAALIGRKFGTHKFLFKSLEGTTAFFVTGSLVIFFSPKIDGGLTEYLIGFAAVGIGAIAENISYGWADDNLTIPISICLAMMLLYAIFFPDLSLILPNVPY
ncbi:MAG: dolichol kinase [Bacteroidetes bacterium]|nr:dolichol kinase [Bacteroidota bacterium]MBU2505901.1 dolichol kinase [Bacteroidota bacterium]